MSMYLPMALKDNLAALELIRRLVIGMNTNKGFTLIELLIVIVIMGITASFALLAFGDFGGSKRIFFSAEQLANTLRLAQQQSLLQSRTMGMHIDNQGFQLLVFQNNIQWESLPNKGIYKPYFFPKNTVIKLYTMYQTTPKMPQIIINPAGEMTPFTLEFGQEKTGPVAVLSGSDNGLVTLSTSSK